MVVVDIRYVEAEAKVKVLPLAVAILGGLNEDHEERGVALAQVWRRKWIEASYYVVCKSGAKVTVRRYDDRREALKSFFFEKLRRLFDAQGLEEEVKPEYIDNGYIRDVDSACREVLWLWWHLARKKDRPTHIVKVYGVDGDLLMVLHYDPLDVMDPLKLLVDEKEIEI